MLIGLAVTFDHIRFKLIVNAKTRIVTQRENAGEALTLPKEVPVTVCSLPGVVTHMAVSSGSLSTWVCSQRITISLPSRATLHY